MYLISLFVCRRRGQGYGAKVCRCNILFRQFRAQGFVGDLDLSFQVFQNAFNPVFGDGLTMPVVKVFNIFRHRISGYSAFRGLFFLSVRYQTSKLTFEPFALKCLCNNACGFALNLLGLPESFAQLLHTVAIYNISVPPLKKKKKNEKEHTQHYVKYMQTITLKQSTY